MPILLGLAALGLLGVAHYAGLKLIARVLRIADGGRGRWPSLWCFLALGLLHTAEITGAAVILVLCEEFFWPAAFGPTANGWWDYHYLAFTTFTTLGFGDAVFQGPVRLVMGHLALGGFMAITWSATFLYDVSRKTADFGLDRDETG